MSQKGIDKLAATSADAASTSTNAPSSSTTADRPLGRGKYTYYGDGIIEYEYKPRKGKVQRVCGILGKDKRETIELVKKGFPDLADIEPERFDFEIYNARCNWVTVMEEAWVLMKRDPPLVWVIKIKDTPEEKQYRIKCRKHGVTTLFLSFHLLIIAIVLVVAAYKLGYVDGPIWGKIKYPSGVAVLLLFKLLFDLFRPCHV